MVTLFLKLKRVLTQRRQDVKETSEKTHLWGAPLLIKHGNLLDHFRQHAALSWDRIVSKDLENFEKHCVLAALREALSGVRLQFE